jgi:Protein of unknown function (DUF1552)
VPNGIILDEWFPITEKEVAALPAILPRISRHLFPYRDRLLTFEGLTCNGGRALGDGPGDHARAGASFLTGAHPKKTAGRDIFVGVSVDQIAAGHIGSQTRFPSLELSCEEGLLGGNCDSGYSCAYQNGISWRTATSPMTPEVLPRAVFDRLFGEEEERDPAKRAAMRNTQGSIIDFVLGSAQQLRLSLGRTDQLKLDEYLYSVRDIEKRIQKTEQESATAGPAPIAPPVPGIPDTFKEHSQMMFELMALAFQTNATRVITFLMAGEQSNRSYREIGIAEGHHGLTHAMGDKEKIEKVVQINEFHLQQFANFLERLRTTPDGDGTLLDHSMIVYGSGLSDGNNHRHDNLPIVMAGDGNGTLRPGRHIKYRDETPLANLWVSMLDRMGVPESKLGDSTGELPSLAEI